MTYEEAQNKFLTIPPSWRNDYKNLLILSNAALQDKREDCYAKNAFIEAIKDVNPEDFKLIRPGSL